MAKDIKVAVDAATEKDLKMPVLQAVSRMWEDAKEEIGAQVDCSEAVKVIERWAGKPIQ